jgi:hypothetical protein
LIFTLEVATSIPTSTSKIHVLDFLRGEERADLLEFLDSLTGEMPPDVGSPATVQAAK